MLEFILRKEQPFGIQKLLLVSPFVFVGVEFVVYLVQIELRSETRVEDIDLLEIVPFDHDYCSSEFSKNQTPQELAALVLV